VWMMRQPALYEVYRELRRSPPGFASALKTPISPTDSMQPSGLLRPMG